MTAAHQCASFSACDYVFDHRPSLCRGGLDVAIPAITGNLAGDFRNLPERHDDLVGDRYPPFHRDGRDAAGVPRSFCLRSFRGNRYPRFASDTR